MRWTAEPAHPAGPARAASSGIPDACFTPLLTRYGAHARIGLAVSGGPDSLAMARVFADWRTRCAPGMQATAITVDHGLRADSAAEARQAGELVRSIGLDHRILTWRGARPGARVQERARIARYDLLHAAAPAHGLDCVATAHTADDQAETVLMRAARGGGLDAASGIPADGHWMDLDIVRPLLGVSRADLVADLCAADLRPIADPSNEDASFERVRARRRLAAEPDLRVALLERAASAQQACGIDDAAARDVLQGHGHVDAAGFALLRRDVFAEPRNIATRLLRALIMRLGGGLYPPPIAATERLLDRLADWPPGGGWTLGGVQLETLADTLVLTREPGRMGSPGPDMGVFDRRFVLDMDADARALGMSGLHALTAETRSRLPGYETLAVALKTIGSEARASRRIAARIDGTLPVVAGKGHVHVCPARAIAPRLGGRRVPVFV